MFSNAADRLPSVVSATDIHRLASSAALLHHFSGYRRSLRLDARKGPGKTQASISSLMSKQRYLTHLQIVGSPTSVGRNRSCVVGLVMGAIAKNRIKLQMLRLEGLFIMDATTLSCIRGGALAQLKELHIGAHYSTEENFKPFLFSLVHCPLLRRMCLGEGINHRRGASEEPVRLMKAPEQEGFPPLESLGINSRWSRNSFSYELALKLKLMQTLNELSFDDRKIDSLSLLGCIGVSHFRHGLRVDPLRNVRRLTIIAPRVARDMYYSIKHLVTAEKLPSLVYLRVRALELNGDFTHVIRSRVGHQLETLTVQYHLSRTSAPSFFYHLGRQGRQQGWLP